MGTYCNNCNWGSTQEEHLLELEAGSHKNKSQTDLYEENRSNQSKN